MHIKTIKIGNMCCGRCVTAVGQVLTRLGINYKEVTLGHAEISYKDGAKENELEEELKRSGFKLLKGQEEEISEKIKIAIHQLFDRDLKINDLANLKLRDYLEAEVELPYKKLSEVFSKQNKKTIENYFIQRRIEEAKRMIHDHDYSFSEIAGRLGYNSLSYLSKQFKTAEGVSMSDYRLKPNNRRKFIDKL